MTKEKRAAKIDELIKRAKHAFDRQDVVGLRRVFKQLARLEQTPLTRAIAQYIGAEHTCDRAWLALSRRLS